MSSITAVLVSKVELTVFGGAVAAAAADTYVRSCTYEYGSREESFSNALKKKTGEGERERERERKRATEKISSGKTVSLYVCVCESLYSTG